VALLWHGEGEICGGVRDKADRRLGKGVPIGGPRGHAGRSRWAATMCGSGALAVWVELMGSS
jgi:hypothetical protein